MDSLSSKCPSRACLFCILKVLDQCIILLRSAIIFPEDKEVIIHTGKIALQGWAYSGGGNWVERVEVSPDG
jgi:hypothetical protein